MLLAGEITKYIMRTLPVSFGSIKVFHINDGNPHAPIPKLVEASFKNHPKLVQYTLVEKSCSASMDATPLNGSQNFAIKLDKDYASLLPKNSKKVILTSVKSYIGPQATREEYYITAPTSKDEEEIHKVLSHSGNFFAAKFPKA